MPGLQSFCVAVAIGLGSIYILQVSWFAAWLSLDEKRFYLMFLNFDLEKYFIELQLEEMELYHVLFTKSLILKKRVKRMGLQLELEIFTQNYWMFLSIKLL